MKYIRKLTALFILCVLAFPAVAGANAGSHGGMFTAKYIDGNNLILLTDNAHGAESGIAIKHNLRLYDMTGQPIPFETAKVTFTQGSKVVAETEQKRSDNGDVTLTYTYPKQGTYTLNVSFLDHDKQVSKADFPLVINKGAGDSFLAGFLTPQSGMALAFGAGIAAAIFWREAIARKVRSYGNRGSSNKKPKTRT